MAQYRLLAPHYLGTRYFAEGSVVDWDGEPSQSMVAVDDDGRAKLRERAEKKTKGKQASEVPQPGGEAPDPTWAPKTKPAFSVKTTRKPAPGDKDQASVVEVAAAAPSGGSTSPDDDGAVAHKAKTGAAKHK